MLALLNFDEYFVDNLSIQGNPSYQPVDEQEVDFNIDYEIGRANDGSPAFELRLLVDVNQSEEFFRKSAYRIHLELTGYFHFPEGTDEKDINRLVLPNGLSILYGIARSTISQSTGVARFGRFLLPSVNLFEVIKNRAKKEKSEGEIQE